jgi:hypothetical protein
MGTLSHLALCLVLAGLAGPVAAQPRPVPRTIAGSSQGVSCGANAATQRLAAQLGSLLDDDGDGKPDGYCLLEAEIDGQAGTEILAIAANSYSCGTAGCDMRIFQRRQTGWAPASFINGGSKSQSMSMIVAGQVRIEPGIPPRIMLGPQAVWQYQAKYNAFLPVGQTPPSRPTPAKGWPFKTDGEWTGYDAFCNWPYDMLFETIGVKPTTTTGDVPTCAGLVDLNRDGRPEIIVRDFAPPAGSRYAIFTEIGGKWRQIYAYTGVSVLVSNRAGVGGWPDLATQVQDRPGQTSYAGRVVRWNGQGYSAGTDR